MIDGGEVSDDVIYRCNVYACGPVHVSRAVCKTNRRLQNALNLLTSECPVHLKDYSPIPGILKARFSLTLTISRMIYRPLLWRVGYLSTYYLLTTYEYLLTGESIIYVIPHIRRRDS